MSIAAVLAGVAAALFLTSLGPMGIPLGLLGLKRTAGGRRRGRQLAGYGLIFGALSICFGFVPFPASFLWPPLFTEDRALQRFFDDVAAGRHDAAAGNPLIGGTRRPEAMGQWASLCNQRLGRGRVIGSVARIHAIPDGAHVYLVAFSKAGWKLVWLVGPDRSTAGPDSAGAKWLLGPINGVPGPDTFRAESPGRHSWSADPNSAHLPKTVPAAVEYVLERLSAKEKAALRDMKRDDLILTHHGLGAWIRHELGLWSGNYDLLLATDGGNPDDASQVIIQAMWEKLQQQRRSPTTAETSR